MTHARDSTMLGTAGKLHSRPSESIAAPPATEKAARPSRRQDSSVDIDLLAFELALLDLDGTLVDTNYQHALAWFRAFRDNGVVLPIWRLHRAIGMGGDNLVEHVAGAEAERTIGDAVRAAEPRHYGRLIGEVEPFEGARELIGILKERGLRVVLATSAKEEELEHYLDLLEARDLVDGWTSSKDVERTKPDPDVVRAAIKRGGGGTTVMVGDTTWDVIAAARAGVATVCVLTGGFAADELFEAGAAAVFESIAELGGRARDAAAR